jgi:hypothetical protein
LVPRPGVIGVRQGQFPGVLLCKSCS